jgi:hypothetical protein
MRSAPLNDVRGRRKRSAEFVEFLVIHVGMLAAIHFERLAIERQALSAYRRRRQLCACDQGPTRSTGSRVMLVLWDLTLYQRARYIEHIRNNTVERKR